MADKLIRKAEASFQSEGRLLQELGERLVASPEVAIVELIKNSYDADATECRLKFDGNALVITDDGVGMTESEYLSKWMRIASGSKEKEQHSYKYKRKYTGAKGIGRFAARFLGKSLVLDSIAYDGVRKIKTRINAKFNWNMFDRSSDLNDTRIHYTLYEVAPNVPTKTELTIDNLNDVVFDSFNDIVRTEVLKIVNPISGLERGHFSRLKKKGREDPGFQVILPGQGDKEPSENLAENILRNYWAKLIISLKPSDSSTRENLMYQIFFSSEEEKENKPRFDHKQHFASAIDRGIFADIRFFPRRAGIFSGKGFSGHEAWRWIYDNKGVAIVDHGFRIKPYGYEEDDWLQIAQDHENNRRDWRSSIMLSHYPMEDAVKTSTQLNPMLYLPANHQLVGAVFLESGYKTDNRRTEDLTPSMDREGYLDNEAFRELRNIVRAGVEMLALMDKKEEERKAKEIAEQEFAAARADVKKAIEYVKAIPTLTERDRTRLIGQYAAAYKNIEEAEDYSRQARQSLEIMSLLGVVAGYMTHENKRALFEMKELIESVRSLSSKYKELLSAIKPLENSYEELQKQMEYSSMFVGAVRDNLRSSFNARAQVEQIIDKFGHHARRRGITVDIDVDEKIVTPEVPIALYSGILLNLFTNSLKAVISDSKPKTKHIIAFKSWNEEKKHIIEVLDNGVGIPPSLQKRIWDPLFTTTSNLNNPFGSGMGLGLNLVKKLLSDIGGSIQLINPPPGYTTCFKVDIPFTRRDG